MKIKRISKVISYRQSNWLKTYIDFNSKLRQVAKKNGNKFEVDFFKLLNNSVYGKFIENLKNRMNYEIRSSDENNRRLINSPRFANFKIFNEHMIGLEMRKHKTVLPD